MDDLVLEKETLKIENILKLFFKNHRMYHLFSNNHFSSCTFTAFKKWGIKKKLSLPKSEQDTGEKEPIIERFQ